MLRRGSSTNVYIELASGAGAEELIKKHYVIGKPRWGYRDEFEFELAPTGVARLKYWREDERAAARALLTERGHADAAKYQWCGTKYVYDEYRGDMEAHTFEDPWYGTKFMVVPKRALVEVLND